MGAAGSSSSRLQHAPPASDDASCGDAVEPPWPLPPVCQDEIWLKVDLSTLVGARSELAGKEGVRACGERRDGGNARDNQAARSLQLSPGDDGHGDEEDDWLDASVCLSAASLRPEEMALLLARVKKKLLSNLTDLCHQDDVFCEAVTKRIHALQCVHAAMTRQRCAQLERGAVDSAIRQPNAATLIGKNAGVAGELHSCPSGDNLLGLQLFFSLLNFVRDPECGQEQLGDFLQQIAPVLSSLPPLCLAGDTWDLPEDSPDKQPSQQVPAPGVVHSLREFLVTLALREAVDNAPLQIDRKRCDRVDIAAEMCNSSLPGLALSAIISLVGARGRASDLLVLVKVLISADHRRLDDAVTVSRNDGEACSIADASEMREEHVLTECSAKRRPASRVKARTSRQGLPVNDDEEDEEEVHDSPLLADPIVTMAVGPADSTIGCDAAGDTWKSVTRTQKSGGGDGDNPPEVHPVKGRKGKGERIRSTPPVHRQQPWQKIERASIPCSSSLDGPSATPLATYKGGGVEASHILPLLRQLHAAAPNGDPWLAKASPVHQREVWTCGQNSYGELGHSDTGTRKVHCLVKMFEGREVIDVAAGNEHTVVLCRTGDVFTAGYNDNGQCGQGTTQRVEVLTRVPILSGRRAVQVHAYNGCEHTLVVLDDGRVMSFGYNYRGQLGHGNTTSEAVPNPVRGLDGIRVAKVSCSYYHSIIACENGEVYAFGRNDFGQLGSGDTIDRKLPSVVDSLRGQRVASLACGQYHTVVSSAEVGVQACGKNDYGQLGVEPSEYQKNLVVVKGALEGVKVKQLRCGYYHTIVLIAGGHVLGFGRNDYGQLGLGHITQRVFGPHLIEGAEGKGVSRVSAGCYHTVLIGSDGMLYVFGRNHHGQLGTGDTNERHSPFPVDTFRGKRVAKVAAGFYHTIVLTGGVDEDNSELDSDRAAGHRFSPHSILTHPALMLPKYTSCEGTTAEAGMDDVDHVGSKVSSPEMNSPVCDRKDDDLPQGAPDIDVGQTKEPQLGEGGVCLGGGRVSGRKAAVIIMAHMDRLTEPVASPTGGVPAMDITAARSTDENVSLASPGATRAGTDRVNPQNHHIYCVDVSPDTFELLAGILASVSEEEQDNEHSKEAHFQMYILLAALRILKSNLARLLQTNISTRIIASMVTGTTPFGLDDASELHLEGGLGHDSGLETRTVESRTGRQANGEVECNDRVPREDCHVNTDQHHGEDDPDRVSAENSNDTGVRSVVERYRDVLWGLQRRLLLLVHAEPLCGGGMVTAEPVQQEAAAVLILGLELFFSSQAEQFSLLSKLINTAALGDDDERDVSVDGDFDGVDQPVCGRRAERCYMLSPLLRRLCNDALASKLIPYGADTGNGSAVCTMVEVSEPALKGYRVVAASAKLLEIEVKLLVDLIAQGNPCSVYSETFADEMRAATFLPRYQERSPSSALQLNGSATDRTESFDLDADATGNEMTDGPDNPRQTQRLFVDLVLTLTKHIMHWAASDRVTVDPVLWRSRVINSGGLDRCLASGGCLDTSVTADSVGRVSARAKRLFERAGSVILDGVDRTPPSWRCLIKHAQLVLKYSTAILEATMERDPLAQGGDEATAEAADIGRIDRLDNTLVGLLLPAVVTGLLPFAHIPVFARRLLDVVNGAVVLLDEACCRCPAIRTADASYVAARNGGGASATKLKTQTLFMRGENGKLGGRGNAGRNPGGDRVAGDTGGAESKGSSAKRENLPWLLSVTKTTALLAGRLAATLVVGDCGISPFLEPYFCSPAYARWMGSDLFAGGCDPFYEREMLASLDIASNYESTRLGLAVQAKTSVNCLGAVPVSTSGAVCSRSELAVFLEEVVSGLGKGGKFGAWLGEALAPSNAAYLVVKRQTAAGRDGRALERAERATMAAMLRHTGLDGDAALFGSQLERQSGEGGGTDCRKPPRRFADLWKRSAEMACWLWHSRSKLKSADADQLKVDALLEEAADSCLVMMLFKPAGGIPPAIVTQRYAHGASVSAVQRAARIRWRKAAVVVRAMIRWRAVVSSRHLSEAVAMEVPRFMRAMLKRRADAGGVLELSAGADDVDHVRASIGYLTVFIVLVLDNHQRAVARASGLRSLRKMADAVNTRSVLGDLLLPVPPAIQTPRLVDRHILGHLSAVGGGITLGVTSAFQELLTILLRILEDYCQFQGETETPTSNGGAPTKGQDPVQTTQGTAVAQCSDSPTVLVLLEIWGLTIRLDDWDFVESSGVIDVLSLITTQSSMYGHGEAAASSSADAKGSADGFREDDVFSRKRHPSRMQGSDASEQGHRLLATCHTAAWTLLRALILQLYAPACATRTFYDTGRGGSEPFASVVEVLRAQLTKCVAKAKSKASFSSGGPKRGAGRGGEAGSQCRDRTPSQAILEFAPPLIGGFPDSPPHARVTEGGKMSWSGASHKRRCQELVSSPRRLMNMEDGFVFPAEHVLSNPRGSDFSITFWLLLAQDRTGHHRTVLARGQGSERWPVVLLRNTDNRLEVCFGIPSMGNLCERLTSKESIQVNRWTHVGLISEHNKLHLYFNGALDSQRTSTGALRANRHPLYVGRVPDGAMRLDGVRGGVEGSIANLRYFTRALSPIHVRIICDPGPPENAKIEDRHFYHLCACLVAISRSPQCRRHLQHPGWLALLLKTLTYGTVRVQQAVCRLLQEILPHVSPKAMANVTLETTGSHVAAAVVPLASKTHSDEDENTLLTAFTAYVLRLAGASSWYIGATMSAIDAASGISQDGDEEDENQMTIAQVILREQVTRFLPLTIAPACLRGDPLGTDIAGIRTGLRATVDLAAAARQSALPVSAEAAHDISTLGAELVALLQTLAATEAWREAVAVALRRCLLRLMRFIDTTGGFTYPDLSDDGNADCECVNAEERLAVAGGEAVLHVLGGSTDFLRAGVCARVRETDQRCTVLSVDQATSVAHVVVHPEGGAITEKWVQRFGSHDLEVRASDPLSRGAMAAFSENSTNDNRCDNEEASAQHCITRLATAFLRSSPLPRLQLPSGAGEVHRTRVAYREIALAQCRSRLARAILRASQNEEWASNIVKTSDLFMELLGVSTLPRSTFSLASGAESLTKPETVGIQNRLRQMLGAPGAGKIVAEKIVEMALNPGESTIVKDRGHDKGSSGRGGGQKRGRGNHRFPTSVDRTWVDSLSCPFCHEEKSTVSGIVEHVMTKHSADMRRVSCPVCVAEKGDDTAHDLPTHLELVHFDIVMRDRPPFLPAFGRRIGSNVGGLETRPPSHLVEQLMVIGFPEDWCTMALRENDNDVVNASAWIVDNLDMLSSLNSLDSSADRAAEVDIASPRVRQEEDSQRWRGRYRFGQERSPRRERRSAEGNNRLADEDQEEFKGEGEEEEKYHDEDELDGDDDEEEDEMEAEQRARENVNEEDEDVEEGEEDGRALQDEEAFDSEEEDEEDEEEDGAGGGGAYSVRGGEDRQQIVASARPGLAIDDAIDNEQNETVESHRIADGLVASDRRESYFPLERKVLHAAGDSLLGCSASERSQLAAVNAEIAGMELCQLTEVWLQTELHLTILYCRAAVVNILLRWPLQVPLCIKNFGSSGKVIQVIESLLFSGQSLPITFMNGTNDSVLQPVPNGARPPKVIGVFTPLLVHLLRSERDAPSPMGTPTATFEKGAAAATSRDEAFIVAERRHSVVLIGEWQNTLSARLVCACLDKLDGAAAPDTSVDVPWVAAESPRGPHRLSQGGKPNLDLLQWLLDLLLSSGCAEIFTENVFSRLSNCLNSSNIAAKEVAVYALTSIATKWSEHLAVGVDVGSNKCAEDVPKPVDMPSPLAMEETFQRHMATSRVRSALVKRIAVERRPGGLFFTRYTQTLAALYVAICKLQRLLLCRRQQSGCEELGASSFTDLVDVSKPAVLYCTESSVALKWLPLRKVASISSILYEVQMAARQLGTVESQDVYRCVYSGKRLRCTVDDLMPGQVYRFRLRAVHPSTKSTAWSAVVAAETEQGTAFRFDSANSGPAIFVSSNELSASFGSNETWSTILGTTPFLTGSNYWELRLDKSTTAYLFIGVATRDADLSTFLGGDDNGWGFIGDRAIYHKRTKVKAYGERFGQGDTIGVTLNMDRGTLSFSKNGRDLGVAFEGLVGGLYPAVAFYNQGQRLSLVQSAFRCPGAGVAILDSPLSTTPESVANIFEVMEAMVSRKTLPQGWTKVAQAGHFAWVAGRTMRYITSLGFELQFDVSDSACRRFGLTARGRVRTPRGNATVIGLCEGVMWLHVDGERGAWFFTAGEIWEGRTAGCFVMSSLDVLGADGRGGWTRWRALDGKRADQQHGDKVIPVRALNANSGDRHLDPSDELVGDFAAARNYRKWTLTADGCIVAALCDHADRHQVSVWNLTPAEVLEILNPVRRRLELLVPGDPIADNVLLCRVSILKQFNHDIVGVLPFADLAEGVQLSGQAESRTFCWGGSSTHRGLAVGVGNHPNRGLGPLLVRLRRSIFLATKQQTLSQAVAITTTHARKADDEYDYPEALPQVTVNRLKAAAGQESLNAETRLSSSVFYQLYGELHSVDTSLLRMGYTHPMDDGQQRTFKVKFEGEGVDDYGGPYREIFTQVAAELTSTVSSALPEGGECVVPILEPAPSSASGGGRDVGMEFTVKANVCQQRQLRTYKFLGQLMGIALRCRVAAPWRLSQVFWKGLVGEALQEADLAHIESSAYAFVRGIHERIATLNPTKQGIDGQGIGNIVGEAEQVLEAASEGLTWTTPAHGEVIELRPGGRTVAVKPSELLAYVQEVAEARLHEKDMALFAVRDGLASVVPTAVLPLFAWEEVELQACGRPGVDIDLLETNTEYDDDISPTDAHIQSFWRVVRTFDDRDRSQFLRFVWARSRLPSKAADFHQKFKIHSPTGEGAREDPDQYLPKAHTCFFSINLPRYSSDEIMAKKLSYTMHNCLEMDADFRLADNEMSGWGNEAAARNSRGQSGGDGANFADQLV